MCDHSNILYAPGKLDILVTIHPSALLQVRTPDEKGTGRLAFIEDLAKIRSFLRR